MSFCLLVLQATLYSLVGSMNKIPLAILGIIAFNEPTNPKNTASICLGLGAGILLTQTKRN